MHGFCHACQKREQCDVCRRFVVQRAGVLLPSKTPDIQIASASFSAAFKRSQSQYEVSIIMIAMILLIFLILSLALQLRPLRLAFGLDTGGQGA